MMKTELIKLDKCKKIQKMVEGKQFSLEVNVSPMFLIDQ